MSSVARASRKPPDRSPLLLLAEEFLPQTLGQLKIRIIIAFRIIIHFVCPAESGILFEAVMTEDKVTPDLRIFLRKIPDHSFLSRKEVWIPLLESYEDLGVRMGTPKLFQFFRCRFILLQQLCNWMFIPHFCTSQFYQFPQDLSTHLFRRAISPAE